MIKHKFTLTVDDKAVFSKEDVSCSVLRDAQEAVQKLLWSQWQHIYRAPKGTKGSINNIGLSWECTMNRRAPARPKYVIAAEKAAQAVKSQARKEENVEREKERHKRIVNIRKRIKSQVDHAFAVGKSGTEPASKYITCQSCDAPADALTLNHPLAPGAQVLDEDTITGALCSKHALYNREEKVLCPRLEFFYDGVRQIAIKP